MTGEPSPSTLRGAAEESVKASSGAAEESVQASPRDVEAGGPIGDPAAAVVDVDGGGGGVGGDGDGGGGGDSMRLIEAQQNPRRPTLYSVSTSGAACPGQSPVKG